MALLLSSGSLGCQVAQCLKAMQQKGFNLSKFLATVYSR